MAVDLDFQFGNFLPLVGEICDLLEVRFVPGDPSNDTPIGRALYSVLVYENNNDFHKRDVEYIRMAFLAKHLKILRENDAVVFKSFRRLLTDPDIGNFLGTRFEIEIAASLARKGIGFVKRRKGGPDFVLKKPYEAGVGIECRALRFQDTNKAIFGLDKIRDACREKSAMSYASRKIALAIEITNLHSSSNATGVSPPVTKENMEGLVEIANDSQYGTLLFFKRVIGHLESGEIWSESRYDRIDSNYTDSALDALLDEHYLPSKNRSPRQEYFVPPMP